MTDLNTLAASIRQSTLKELAQALSPPLNSAGWSLDTSRQYLSPYIRSALNAHAEHVGLHEALMRLFDGAIVNPSENRPALHWALRANTPLEGEAAKVRASLTPAMAFADKVRASARLKTIIHIGIGGSDFGPRLLADAFSDKGSSRFDLRFVANVDPHDFTRAIAGANPETTLVIGVSKSFGTEETLYNLAKARTWLAAKLGVNWPAHISLITANRGRAEAWLSEPSQQIFDMPLAVGGRYSLWSAASLACLIWFGTGFFMRILSGAAHMDTHVKMTPISENMAIQLALLDYWNSVHLGANQRVVLAYANRLRLLPIYLQQLEMESNGKSVKPTGDMLNGPSAPAVWGGEGSVGQHSYHQWLHQGTQSVPTEFIIAPDIDGDNAGRTALIAHALAQAEVLANGRNLADIKSAQPGLDDVTAQQKFHAGGRASTVLFHPQFGPEAFGALLALYEHRTYLSGVLWGLNPFDQWGVEYGKTVAERLKPVLVGEGAADDLVTKRLVSWVV